MYASPDLLASIIEANPHARAACRAIGQSPTQVAYSLIDDLAHATPGQRDQMIGTFCAEHGVYGIGSMKDFSHFIDDIGSRYTGETARVEQMPFAPKLDRTEQAAVFSLQSQHTPLPWKVGPILHVAKKAAVASLTSGLNKRLAARDGEPAPGLGEKYRDDHDDRQHLRGLIAEGLGDGEQRKSRWVGRTPATASLGETVAAAYDYADQQHTVDDQNAEIDDHNRRMSNTLFEAD